MNCYVLSYLLDYQVLFSANFLAFVSQPISFLFLLDYFSTLTYFLSLLHILYSNVAPFYHFCFTLSVMLNIIGWCVYDNIFHFSLFLSIDNFCELAYSSNSHHEHSEIIDLYENITSSFRYFCLGSMVKYFSSWVLVLIGKLGWVNQS